MPEQSASSTGAVGAVPNTNAVLRVAVDVMASVVGSAACTYTGQPFGKLALAHPSCPSCTEAEGA
jgi:hypothetical protein